jgi:tetratricopeptide (TPR) repeat protein
MRGMMRFQTFGLVGLLLSAGLAFAVDISREDVTRLIRFSERNVEDSRGWALDLLDVLRAHDFEPSRENVCASLAVIDQESSFRANPAVPGLGKVSEEALRRKFGRIPIAGSLAITLLESAPTADDSYMSRIRNAHTERDLDMAFRGFVEDASKRTNLGLLVNSGLLNDAIENRNDINTVGSMQVSVKFAIDAATKKRWLPMQLADVYGVRDDLYTRRGGMYYGVLQLLGYDSGYNKKIYRFADYNAGRYASRNAAFQQAVATLSKQSLALDGDLLLYDKGKARSKVSASEAAIRLLSRKYKMDLDDTRIREDLLEEKSVSFTNTRTFNRVRDVYMTQTGQIAVFAIVPDIALNSPKISRRMSTRIFAEQVNKKYQACMGFGM